MMSEHSLRSSRDSCHQEAPIMNPRSANGLVEKLSEHHSRRATVRRLIVGGGATVLAGRSLGPAAAQDAAAGECVATAPPAKEGIGFAPLLVGGIVRTMPTGP